MSWHDLYTHVHAIHARNAICVVFSSSALQQLQLQEFFSFSYVPVYSLMLGMWPNCRKQPWPLGMTPVAVSSFLPRWAAHITYMGSSLQETPSDHRYRILNLGSWSTEESAMIAHDQMAICLGVRVRIQLITCTIPSMQLTLTEIITWMHCSSSWGSQGS